VAAGHTLLVQSAARHGCYVLPRCVVGAGVAYATPKDPRASSPFAAPAVAMDVPFRRFLLLLALATSSVSSARAAVPAPHGPAAREAAVTRVSSAALAAVAERQREDGLFADQTGRLVGAGGLPTLAWAALHADGPGAADRAALARRTLARGSGATVILRWRWRCSSPMIPRR